MQRILAGLAVAFAAVRAEAQTEFRSLDPGRPGVVEDAYPIPRLATEASLRFAAGPGARRFLHPEIGMGIGRGLEASVSGPIALVGANGTVSGGTGGQISLFANLTTERPALPALALRLEAWIPEGPAAGHGIGATLRGLATRSFGRQRVHFNGSVALAHPDDPGQRDIPLWIAGAALDRTLIRSSTLLVGEVTAARDARGAPLRTTVGLGLRRQLTPVLVFDVGGFVEHQPGRQELGVSVGFSHVLGDGFLLFGGSR